MMRKTHKAILASIVILVLISLIAVNAYQTLTDKAEKVITELENDKEIRDELYIDSKQVYEVLEKARNEQRELTFEEKQLIDEFDAKYNRESLELTHAEKMVIYNLLLMSRETVPTSKLESEQNMYEEYKSYLLEYVEY